MHICVQARLQRYLCSETIVWISHICYAHYPAGINQLLAEIHVRSCMFVHWLDFVRLHRTHNTYTQLHIHRHMKLYYNRHTVASHSFLTWCLLKFFFFIFYSPLFCIFILHTFSVYYKTKIHSKPSFSQHSVVKE